MGWFAIFAPFLVSEGSKLLDGDPETNPSVDGAVDSVSSLFGPTYDPANGGEVGRQLAAMPEWANDPSLREAYGYYLQTWFPALWNTGNIWDVPRSVASGHPSAFRDRYLQLQQEGNVPGQYTVNPSGAAVQPESSNKSGGGLTIRTKVEIPSWVYWVGGGLVLLWLMRSSSGRSRATRTKRKSSKSKRQTSIL